MRGLDTPSAQSASPPGTPPVDAATYHQILAEMVAELEKLAAHHDAVAVRFDARAADLRNQDVAPAYSMQKAEEHREEADILRRRIDALKAGMECLTW